MESPYKGKTGLKRVWGEFFYSLAGLRAAIRHKECIPPASAAGYPARANGVIHAWQRK